MRESQLGEISTIQKFEISHIAYIIGGNCILQSLLLERSVRLEIILENKLFRFIDKDYQPWRADRARRRKADL